MIDYADRGLEAVVNPEHTRRDIVAMLKSGEHKHVSFIHHVDGLFIEDVTDELFDQAESELREEARFTPISAQNAIDWQNDRKRAEETV
jgi:cell division protein YceG involved in septum cleavage